MSIQEIFIPVGESSLFMKHGPTFPIQAAQALTQTWNAMQEDLSKLSTRGIHLKTSCGHYIHHDEPALVVETIHQVVQTIRNISS